MYITFHGAWIHSIWLHGVEELVLNVWKHGQINMASKNKLTRASDKTSSRDSKSRLYHTRWNCWSSKIWPAVLTCMYIQKKSICVNVYICVHTYICLYTYVHISTTQVWTCAHVCICIYILDRISTCTFWYIHTYIRIRVGSVCAYE